MAQQRSAKQSNLIKTLAITLIGVVVLVGGVYAFLEYQRNRPVTPVRDLNVEIAAAGSEEVREIPPYTVCELDEECVGDEAPTVSLGSLGGAEEVVVRVPREVSQVSWRLLLVYDDPDANEERILQSGESQEETVPTVTDSGARLVVAEVSALTIDVDDNGEETPVIATWSVGFEE